MEKVKNDYFGDEENLDLKLEHNFNLALIANRLLNNTLGHVILSTELGKLKKNDLVELADTCLKKLDEVDTEFKQMEIPIVEDIYEDLDGKFDIVIDKLSENFASEYKEKISEDLLEDMQEFITIELDKYSKDLKKVYQ